MLLYLTEVFSSGYMIKIYINPEIYEKWACSVKETATQVFLPRLNYFFDVVSYPRVKNLKLSMIFIFLFLRKEVASNVIFYLKPLNSVKNMYMLVTLLNFQLH